MDALEDLYRQFHGTLVAEARFMQPDDPEDLVMELWASHPVVPSGVPPLQWLRGCLRRHWGWHGARRKQLLPVVPLDAAENDTGPGNGSYFERGSITRKNYLQAEAALERASAPYQPDGVPLADPRRLEDCCRSLTAPQAFALDHLYLRGQTSMTAGAFLGVTASAVRHRARNGIRRLCRCMA